MWHATALMVIGAALGVTGYILWSSRATHSDHSHYDAATSVRAVQSRVLGDRWAKRYGYSPLGPNGAAECHDDLAPTRQRSAERATPDAESPEESTRPIRVSVRLTEW